MADKKISALPAATTPLAGTEVLPIVQGGTTDQVSVANLTAGRNIDTAAITTTGNVGVKCTPLSITPLQVSLGTDRRLSTFLNGSDNVLGFLTDAGNWTSTFFTGTPAIFGNGATEAFRIGTDQNIAIKTSGKGITTGSAIPLGFGVNGSVAAMTIDTSSNVGIGTTAPDIFGRFYTRSVGINSAGTTVLQINGTTYGAVDLGFNGVRTATMLAETGGFYIQTTNASNMYLLTNGLERIRIESGGNVGIGAAPAATALLDVQSTTKGVRFPNMTTGQKTAITPSAGTVIFDTDLAKLCVYSGAAWQTITSV
jgi:hypothetical protein